MTDVRVIETADGPLLGGMCVNISDTTQVVDLSLRKCYVPLGTSEKIVFTISGDSDLKFQPSGSYVTAALSNDKPEKWSPGTYIFNNEKQITVKYHNINEMWFNLVMMRNASTPPVWLDPRIKNGGEAAATGLLVLALGFVIALTMVGTAIRFLRQLRD